MLLLKRPKAGDPDPTIQQRAALGTRIHVKDSVERVPIQAGEHVIIKDGPLERLGTVPKYPESRETGWKSIITPRSHRHSRTTQLRADNQG